PLTVPLLPLLFLSAPSSSLLICFFSSPTISSAHFYPLSLHDALPISPHIPDNIPESPLLPTKPHHKTVQSPIWKGKPRFGYSRRSEEHTSELQSRFDLVCRLLLDKNQD